uniref:Uncharacterized protein n=1 Tax=Pristhesancus plagipennis TaxID=1955184 RepID=A0A2K8JMH3_PRIPG|nr:secreted hypothetical protein [Pristhesancus plagipennis]
MVLFKYWLMFLVFTLLDAAQKLPPCRLGSDLLNGLVNSNNKDTDEYGIENAFGLMGEDPGNETEKQDLSEKEFQDCIQHYIHSGPLDNDTPSIAPLNLHYEPLPNMGNNIEMPLPIPDDEDYLPGKEGYTTYVNPYNFKEKGYFNKTKSDDFLDDLLNFFEDWL